MPLPFLHRDWAHPRHICTETALSASRCVCAALACSAMSASSTHESVHRRMAALAEKKLAQFWAAHQRFFRSLLTAYKLPTCAASS